MSKNELMATTASAPVADSLDGHTDEVAGEESRKSGLIRNLLKFGNTAEWETKDGDVIDAETHLILIGVDRVVTRWGKDKKPAETIVLGPREKFPDVEAWNEQLPKSEWVEGPNGPQGPWQSQQILQLLDPTTMKHYSWPTSSVGGSIGIRQLVEAVRVMRRFRPGACPVIELSSTFMKTRFGGRQRPHFVIHNWISMPGADPEPAALPAPTSPPTAPAAAAAPTEPVATVQRAPATRRVRSKSFLLGDTIKPVTLQEEMNDEIPI